MQDSKIKHPFLLWLIKVGVILFLLICFVWFYIVKDKQYKELAQHQKNCRHILIDEIDNHGIWLIIYEGDTVGVVAIK